MVVELPQLGVEHQPGDIGNALSGARRWRSDPICTWPTTAMQGPARQGPAVHAALHPRHGRRCCLQRLGPGRAETQKSSTGRILEEVGAQLVLGELQQLAWKDLAQHFGCAEPADAAEAEQDQAAERTPSEQSSYQHQGSQEAQETHSPPEEHTSRIRGGGAGPPLKEVNFGAPGQHAADLGQQGRVLDLHSHQHAACKCQPAAG
mmetsp:Transcript_11561/g.24342  ORF Transcript_11561/g.24342 Transcript_11561/m.24342 type:complete len:205 (+) Transcript_11561:742-1356(+)